MRKAILLAIATILLAANTAALTMDVNGGMDPTTYQDELEDGVQCVADDGNVTITVTDANGCTALVLVIDGTPAAGSTYSPWPGDTNAHYGEAAPYDDNVMTVCDANTDGIQGAVLNVNVPTAEGLHYVCVVDDNFGAFAATATDCEWINVKPDSTYTGYTITNSDGNGFCKTTAAKYAAFEGKIEDSTGYGKIENPGTYTLDISADIDFDSGFTWSARKITSTILSNKYVKVTYLKPEISTANFEIRKNDSGCSTCNNVDSSNGQISFTTNTFSSYEVVEVAVGDEGRAGVYAYQPAAITAGIGGIVQDVGTTNIVLGIIVAIIVVVLVAAKAKK